MAAFTSTLSGTKLPLVQRVSTARASLRVSASLRSELAQGAKFAGVSVASLALALAANAAEVKLGADSGALVFEPATVTIKAGDSVTWTNNAGFPHNVVFDEDAVPVRHKPRLGVGLRSWPTCAIGLQSCNRGCRMPVAEDAVLINDASPAVI